MPVNPPLPKPKVLVVDDTPANLVAMRRLLARMDCEVVEAGSGNAALAACLEDEFALILLDVQMPDMDGFEVATLLADNADTHGAPVIFVTAAYKDDLARMTGYEVGAVDYIAKPVNEFILLSKVKVFLDLYRTRAALKLAERAARHQATHDPLTDLPNRILFQDRLQSGVARAQRENRSLALVYIDIDRFKPVNDRYGHLAGDLLLKAIAERLLAMFRATDTIARLGGDEFAAIFEHVDGAAATDVLIAAIRNALQQPFTLKMPAQSVTVEVGASLGSALYPEDGRSAEELIARADARMYEIKRTHQRDGGRS
ncbi:diguanylate cyclase domain-containing protein [Solimonas soli]|uniref:diguanylate cyclase domain-containing protein n=1 Tax=Solimonas soli TaxID=413479 RepID=UPI00048785E2|nr:diguanylate cyclase [Solimonas soli]